MKSYELIIETRQPPCGGKPPKVYQFLEIETDDPVSYVRQQEAGAALEVSADGAGDTVVEVRDGQRRLTYRFTEA